MKTIGGVAKRRKGGLVFLITLLSLCLALPGPTPARADSSGDTKLAIGAAALGIIFTPLIAYGVYRNLPSQQGKEEKIFPGEFYVGLYMGASFTASQELRYNNGARLLNGVRTPKFTTDGSRFETGVAGGWKFGYFFKSIPYLGLELEMNFAPSRVQQLKNETVKVRPPLQGNPRVVLPNDDWVNWTTAGHIVGRYGFLRDSEVPFGRLQPYIGVGPGFVVMYDQGDAAKNFSIDAMAGIRYMLLKNVSAFVEYKFSYQFDAEMEDHKFVSNGVEGRGTASLDFENHKVVFGVSYHF